MTQVEELKDPPVRNYLGSLNEAQREAVEFGVVHRAGESLPGPLLVIAGAGSGKTNTLAHRVAHLIANGADPGKILLLTFSRRAAVEMTRRVERIIGHLMKVNRGAVTGSLAWSGTFHSVGARLLREYAGRIGLAPGFTIHDREDSADLLNLVRHDLGFSAKDKRFPLKATCLGIYSAVINTQARLTTYCKSVIPGARNGSLNSGNYSCAMSRPSRTRRCSTTTTSSCIGRGW
jgi:DNA helicase-2/ATP-dependent DNA helicase PcrA